MSVPVLDKGFVRLVDHMGSDLSVVQAAKVSYRASDEDISVAEQRRLIRYLMRHRHTSPFEMCEVILHVKLPIFVARQWIRHRTASVNEVSGRYKVLEDEFFIPTTAFKQSTNNKQGRSDVTVDFDFKDSVKEVCSEAFDTYNHFVELGVAKEMSRIVLPLNTYTEWYWKCDLHNLMHFLKLRLDPHAQYEIRVYAEAIFDIVQNLFPLCVEAFEDYVLKAKTFSRMEMEILREAISIPFLLATLKDIDLPASEKSELLDKLGVPEWQRS